jgi:hypothetical protein
MLACADVEFQTLIPMVMAQWIASTNARLMYTKRGQDSAAAVWLM